MRGNGRNCGANRAYVSLSGKIGVGRRSWTNGGAQVTRSVQSALGVHLRGRRDFSSCLPSRRGCDANGGAKTIRGLAIGLTMVDDSYGGIKRDGVSVNPAQLSRSGDRWHGEHTRVPWDRWGIHHLAAQLERGSQVSIKIRWAVSPPITPDANR